MSSITSLVKCLQVRPGAYPRVEHLKGPLLGKAPALPANLRLGWRGLPGKNILAYYEKPQITVVKSFITLAPGVVLLESNSKPAFVQSGKGDENEKCRS